jgi:Zn finger protein HypA/HybF involved in hydrogenase expression|tara:strand:- start:6979 stop:7149 length:171 start_codon:yes stop_codon:yes gene_type:complete
MFKATRTKTREGYDIIEYLYECPECDEVCWSDSKRLFKRCPKCFVKKVNIRMRLAV